jgi:hypothetical protein
MESSASFRDHDCKAGSSEKYDAVGKHLIHVRREQRGGCLGMAAVTRHSVAVN